MKMNGMKRHEVIGIVGKYWDEGMWSSSVVNSKLVNFIYESGGIPLVLPLHSNSYGDDTDIQMDYLTIDPTDITIIDRFLNMCDGVILQGGLRPAAQEVQVASMCINYDIPILGICAGFNNMARATNIPIYKMHKTRYGKSTPYLRYHNVEDDDIYRHPITLNQSSKLYDIVKCKTMSVNSIHQTYLMRERAERYTDQIIISSVAKDDTVESFEFKNKRFAMAVKWHPELMKGNKYSKQLLNAFMEECKK